MDTEKVIEVWNSRIFQGFFKLRDSTFVHNVVHICGSYLREKKTDRIFMKMLS